MGTIRVVVVTFAWLALIVSRALCQCPELTESAVESVTGDFIAIKAPEGFALMNLDIHDFNVNCLAATPTRGYREATVTVNYTANDDSTGTVQMYLRCQTETWHYLEVLNLPRTVGGTNVTAGGLLVSETDNSCISCSPFSSSSAPDSRCSPCNVQCDMGLMHCFENASSGAQQCCNFYDVNDNCVSECGTNQESSGDYTCLCSGFFEPQLNCTICNINNSTCVNGSPVMETCSCNCTGTGYSGLSCDQDVDECAQQSMCTNNGSCLNTMGSFLCTCMPGYTGTTCDQNIDDCAVQPCENGATCHDALESYSCECAGGYSGENCELNINDCEASSCLNGGMCIDEVDNFSCECLVGYSGPTCEDDIDECASKPCANSGVCSEGIGEFSCRCIGAWRGETCEECFIENCASPACEGDQAFCRECSSRFSLVGDAMCVACPINNCDSCSRDNVCSTCMEGYELVADDLCSLPPEPLLSRVEIVGLSVGLLVLVLIVTIMVIFTLLFLKKKNWYKPAMKDPGKEDKDIILSKITKI